MSILTNFGNGIAGVLQATDARVQDARFGFDFSGQQVDIRPWLDGKLWTRSRLSGSDAGGIILGNDCQSTGRFEADTQDILGGGTQKKIIGSTLDSTGAPLGSCLIEGFLTATNEYVGSTVSDSAGYYVLPTKFTGAHYLVAYRAGSPNVAGTTDTNITPV